MVRLKDWAGMGFVFYLVHFNSTMVRLKAFSFFVSILDVRHFNSTMVRLKAIDDKLIVNYVVISIPLWFG